MERMCKAAKIPKSLLNVKLDIKREKEWNKWLETLKKSINYNMTKEYQEIWLSLDM